MNSTEYDIMVWLQCKKNREQNGYMATGLEYYDLVDKLSKGLYSDKEVVDLLQSLYRAAYEDGWQGGYDENDSASGAEGEY